MSSTSAGRDLAPAEPRPAPRSRWPRRAAVGALLLIIAAAVAAAGVHGWAEYHFRAAQKDLDRLHFLEARGHLDQCLRVWPRSARVNFLYARTSRRLGDLESAEKYLQLCQDRAAVPADDVTLERMLIRAQRGEVRDVQSALRALVDGNHPDSLLILEAMTRGHALLLRFSDMDFLLHIWLERDPNSTLALFFSAWVREQMGPREEAVNGYRTVLARDEENDEARLRLANLLLERSQPAEALQHYEVLDRRTPDLLTVKVGLARSWHDLGRLDEARDLLDRVLAREPDYAPALTARGRLALQQGQPQAAEGFLKKATDLNRTDFPAIYLLLESLERQNKVDEATKLKLRMKQMDADIRQAHELIAIKRQRNPDDPEINVQIAIILLRAGDTREGLRWLSDALKLDPSYPRAHEELAKYYESINDNQRALRHRRLAEQSR